MESRPPVTDPSNVQADLNPSWHIPRPTLARSLKSSRGSTSSNDSTQSTHTGSLLLTAANLAQIHGSTEKILNTRDQNIRYYLQQANPAFVGDLGKEEYRKEPDADAVSVASSMHFTVVNMNARPPVKRRSFCQKHQLTVLVVTMSVLFTIGILGAVLFMEYRAKRQH